MASRDTAQLILEVDARIATAQRDVNRLARSLQQDAAGMDNSIKKIEQSGERLGRSLGGISGRTRSGFTQLSFQIGDVTQGLAMGTRASTIFAQQSGQVIQALQIMGGEGNKFLQFLGGPWGIAISTAVVILGTLGSKLFDTGDTVDALVEKMRKQAKQQAETDQAHKLFAQTLDGVDQSLQAVEKAYAEYENRLKGSTQTQLDAARQALAIADARRQEAAATLQAAKAEIERQNALATGAETKGHVDPRLVAADQARGRISQAEKDLADAESRISRAKQDIEKFQSVATVEKASASAADKINQKYDALIEKARQRALAEHKVGDELKRQVEQLTNLRNAELKALQDRSTANNRQSGRQVSFSEAERIARSAGFQVNSGFRSVAEQAALFNDPNVNRPGNPVARPGTSAHNGVNGKWAIDIQITDGVSPAKIRKVFADQGVSLSKVLKEKGHFHIEGSRSEAASAEREQATAAAKAVREQNVFEEANDRLDQELIRAKNQLVQGVDGQADAAIQELQVAQKSSKDAIDNDVQEGKLSQAQAEILKSKVDQIAFEKMRAVEIQRSLARLQRADEIEQRSFDYRVDDLKYADEVATTQAEHRRIQLDILDVVYQQKEAHLRALKAELELAGKIEEAADVQAQIDRLPTERSRDEGRVNRGTMGPLEAWGKDIPQTAAEINEAFQSIEAQGLEGLSRALTDVITGTRSLKEAFGDLAKSIIADLIQMTIKMLIFRALSSALGGFGSGSLPGSNGGMSANGLIDDFLLTGRAAGGPVRAGQAYIVGEKRPEIFVPQTNGMIIPRVGIAASGSQTQRIVVELRDEMLSAKIAQGSDVQIMQRYPAMRADTIKSMQERSRRR